MLKRFGLFLLVNFLVIVMVSLILNVLLPALGIHLQGTAAILVMCAVFGMTGAFISLAISRWMAKRAYNITVIDQTVNDPGLRNIYAMVARLSQQAQLPNVPEVGVYDSPEPNAFATGPTQSRSLVAFSTGLLRGMRPEEVEAVAAHEISHIKNGDMVTMTLLTGVANTFVMFLSRMVAMALDNFMRDEEGNGGLGFIGYYAAVFVLDMVFMFLASIPLAAFSRWREYRADAGGARLTTPTAMANALERLKNFSGDIAEQKDQFAMAKISSGLRMSLFSSHPPLDERISRLRKMVR